MLRRFFFRNRQNGLQYRLLLITYKESDALLFLISPCFHLSALKIDAIEAITQFVLSDLLVDLFQTNGFDFIGKFLRRSQGCFQFSIEELAEVKNFITRQRTNTVDNFESNIQIIYAMKALATADNTESSGEFTLSGSLQVARWVNKVRVYVKENFQKQITLDKAAEVAGMSNRHFVRLFKQFTGIKFIDYLNRIRVEEAVRLLQNTSDTITGIGYSCGFSSPHYFNKVFKHHKGMTPREVRIRN
jgi:AraC-like DNA-binding protein